MGGNFRTQLQEAYNVHQFLYMLEGRCSYSVDECCLKSKSCKIDTFEFRIFKTNSDIFLTTNSEILWM
jgi:hypothetical protein